MKLNVSDAARYDAAIASANNMYCKKNHNLCFQNCHSHVATVLDDVEYLGVQRWNMVILAFWMFFGGRFVSFQRFLISFLPSIIFYGVILLISLST